MLELDAWLAMSLRVRPLVALLLLIKMSLASALRLPRQVDAAEVIANQTGAARQFCQRGEFECVPYYHCDSDDIITDGVGALDIRWVYPEGGGGVWCDKGGGRLVRSRTSHVSPQICLV
ncbi:hypothetical protein FJT64_020794 [Amphibalanus amphitrite]|uniref:PPAF-2-like Clip domain-containing protein n=1 Tax=Amphibalanus amphitrite TaxID=1232801 RepID=A0A6A4WRJ9_AMPAM|nr:hypothetical protein FJT64_020794 [Amphibalanus amphitrite]